MRSMEEFGLDDLPPKNVWAAMAVQHLLTMYASAITVPLLVGGALHLPVSDIAYLISSALLVSGLATLLQCLGIGGVGIRMPVVMGMTIVAVLPAVAIASDPALGLPAAYGASIGAGLVLLLLMPVIGRLTVLLQPIVTGTTLLLIGLSLIGVALDWVGGGRDSPTYGSPSSLVLAGITLVTILLVARFGRGLAANCAILVGMATGYVVAAASGMIDVSPIHSAGLFALVMPFHFGPPRFVLGPTLSMVVVLLVTVVESGGMLKALGLVVGVPVDRPALVRGLRADAIGAVMGGIFSSFPFTSYSSNLAVIEITGIRSRYVCAGTGGILILLALIPKLSALVATIPAPVLGGASVALFGLVATAGMRSFAAADLSSRSNGLIAGVSLTVGMIPILGSRLLSHLPPALEPVLNNGVLLGTVTAIVLNLFFNGLPAPERKAVAEDQRAAPDAIPLAL